MIKRVLAQPAVSCGRAEGRRELAEPGIEFKIAEVADCRDDAPGLLVRWRRKNLLRQGEFNVRPDFFESHRSCFDRTREVFAHAPKVFACDEAKLSRAFLRAET